MCILSEYTLLKVVGYYDLSIRVAQSPMGSGGGGSSRTK